MTAPGSPFDFSQLDGNAHLVDLLSMKSTITVLSRRAQPQPIHLDALDLFRSIQFADRWAARPPRTTTARTISVVIPVRKLDRWTDPEVSGVLHRLLNFATQDDWNVRFVQRAVPEPQIPQRPMLTHDVTDPYTFRVGLFSGGLDSVAGAALQAYSTPERRLLVSGTGSRWRRVQDDLFTAMNLALPETAGRRFHGATFDLTPGRGVTDRLKDRLPCGQEVYSQRSRGLMFLAMGAVTATTLGVPVVEVYENGVGAINLPFNNGSIGADHSRAMHPLHLALVQRLYRLLFHPEFRVVNPYAFTTKGVMVRDLAHANLGHLAARAVTCEYYGTQAHGTKLRDSDAAPHEVGSFTHCGICTSCLLRRASTLYGGVDDALYRENPPVGVLGREAKNARWYALMKLQVDHLAAALADQPERNVRTLMQAFPDLLLAVEGLRELHPELPSTVIGRQLAQMYAQYVLEFNLYARTLPIPTAHA